MQAAEQLELGREQLESAIRDSDGVRMRSRARPCVPVAFMTCIQCLLLVPVSGSIPGGWGGVDGSPRLALGGVAFSMSEQVHGVGRTCIDPGTGRPSCLARIPTLA